MVHICVIVPVKNGAPWLDDCFQSILNQSVRGVSDVTLSVAVFDDASDDNSPDILALWKEKLSELGINVSIGQRSSPSKGVGFARNRAIEMIAADFYCFLDCDDVMHPQRIEKQLNLCQNHTDALIGCQVMLYSIIVKPIKNRFSYILFWGCSSTETKNLRSGSLNGATIYRMRN